MKYKSLIYLILLTQVFFAQTNSEPEYFMGSSLNSDSLLSINSFSLTSNSNIKAFYSYNGESTIKDGLKYGQYGIDVSKWQGDINWKEVAADSLPTKAYFVILKATQGVSYVDPKYLNNFSAAKANGFVVGAYHFYNQEADPILQANNFINTVKLSKGDLMPILDIERNCFKDCASIPDLLIEKTKLIENIKIWVDKVESHFKTKVVIYTGEAFYTSHLSSDLKDMYFWIAKYSQTPPKCFDIASVYSVDNPCYKNSKKGCWQYSCSGKIKGIKTNVDLNFLNNYYLLKWLIK